MPVVEPTAQAYSARYLRLVELLKGEASVEPRYNSKDPGEWLIWVHGVRWMLVRTLEHRPRCPTT